MTKIGPGTLKCVVAPGKGDRVLAALPERVDTSDVRQLGSDVILVHTLLEPSGLRDWLSGCVEAGGALLVMEFETWSGFGEDVDRVWLLERGH